MEDTTKKVELADVVLMLRQERNNLRAELHKLRHEELVARTRGDQTERILLALQARVMWCEKNIPGEEGGSAE